ncbi:hypothetical protein [Streptomyces palmae]|uniref:Uncharacterized protein n=1 Tax=Streptomyces palmae TaxID=1701085 RepID=A0A4Z0GXB6_9ACTN|nr:hypothetical protein [Streptomyces palmae]TGB01734.1 hypothetical protein E4099_20975 [Streptomyces palmae]
MTILIGLIVLAVGAVVMTVVLSRRDRTGSDATITYIPVGRSAEPAAYQREGLGHPQQDRVSF